MTKVGKSLVESTSEALAYAKGEADDTKYGVHVPEHVDVKAVRASLKLSQDKFADEYGFVAATIRDWEQHRRTPDRYARMLLRVIEAEPEAVKRALGVG